MLLGCAPYNKDLIKISCFVVIYITSDYESEYGYHTEMYTELCALKTNDFLVVST